MSPRRIISEDIASSSILKRKLPLSPPCMDHTKRNTQSRRTIFESGNATTKLMNSWTTVMVLSLLSSAARVQASSCLKSLRHYEQIRTCAFLPNGAYRTIQSKSNSPNRNNEAIFPSIARTSAPLATSTTIRMNSYSSLEEEDPNSFSLSGYQRPKVNWYPGHIAKAERQLSETLKSVDVVIEVRDARAPKATAHPQVGKWTAGRPRVVVLTRMDTVTTRSRETWRSAYEDLGADRWEERLGGEEKNRNVQMRKEQGKYDKEEQSDSVGGTGVEEVLFVDAKRGQGTHSISRAVYRAGRHVNERRRRRGLNDRALRVGIIGFPNVGKSALINRLLGRKRARTANTPGVTRSLQWIRVAADKYAAGASGSKNQNRGENARKKGFELLDSPGIIPSDMLDQNDALLLAAMNSVGVGAYDNQAVAAYLCDRIQNLVLMKKDMIAAPAWRQKCIERYFFDPIKPLSEQNIAARWGSESTDGSANTWIQFAADNYDRIPTGEDMLFIVADNTCKGDPENAARKILQDFRTGRMGPVALQLAPVTEGDDGQTYIDSTREDGLDVRVVVSPTDAKRMVNDQEKWQKEEIEQRAKAAMVAAKEKGLELPPVMESVSEEEDDEEGEEAQKPAESEVGKGLFDGW